MTAIDLTDLIIQKRDEILAIAAEYGATNVRIFGSIARGDYSEHSDVDLLVDMDDESKLFVLTEALEKAMGVHVDVGTVESFKSDRMRNYILQECIQL